MGGSARNGIGMQVQEISLGMHNLGGNAKIVGNRVAMQRIKVET